jgi:hypothetical protein
MLRKKKNRKKNKGKNKLISRRNIAIVLLSIVVSLAVVYSINYFGLFKTETSTQMEGSDASIQELMDKMKKMLNEEKKRLLIVPNIVEKKIEKLPLKERNIIQTKKESEKENDLSEIKDYKKSLEKLGKHIKIPIIKKKYHLNERPKLAIIIDDVAFSHQTKMIKQIPFKVSPSFFPPTTRHPDTVELSKEFKFAMIHIPMEALSYANPEPDTLVVGDSIETMRARVEQIKDWFPSIDYYNNHTGSKFTSDLSSVDKFMRVAQSEHIYFVDSRTTALTKVPMVAEKYNIFLYSRDIFLDNNLGKSEILDQLKKAIAIARKHGFAIAIGHPHANTLSVLKNAKSLLKDIDVVYVKDL